MFKGMCSVIFIIFLSVAGLTGTYEATYSRLVTCTSYKNDIYTFTDNQGNDWKWEREEKDNFEVGKVYRLIMDDNHSSSIYDDIIKKIKNS